MIATHVPNPHPIHIATAIRAGPTTAHSGTPGGDPAGRPGAPVDGGVGVEDPAVGRPPGRGRGVSPAAGRVGCSVAVVLTTATRRSDRPRGTTRSPR
jgi:hypothetical protein